MNDRRVAAVEPPRSCAVRAHATVAARLADIAALRDRAGPTGVPPLPGRFLRHCDEQTVVGVHAVLAALAAFPDAIAGIGRHGVVGAPCRAGRLATARSLVQMRSAGAVAVSTHVVPQCSLHSLAGAISVALGMHGPHLGAGGGPDALSEGILTARALLAAAPPGLAEVWLVATQWDDEPRLDDAAAPRSDPVCRGLALLLSAAGSGVLALETLRAASGRATGAAGCGPTPLAEFARALEIAANGTQPISWSAAGACPLEIRLAAPRHAVPAESARPPAREVA